MMTTTKKQMEFQEARNQVLLAQKTSKGAPAYSRFINRPLGGQLAAMAYVAGIRPNQVTALSALCTFSAISMIALVRPTLISCLVLVFLLVLGYALDAADGQLARLRGGGNAAGEWLDHVIDSLKLSSLHLAVLICWFRFYDLDPIWYLAPVLFQCITPALFFAMILTDQLRRAHIGSAGMLLKGTGNSSVLYSLMTVPTDYGLLCLAFTLLAWPTGFIFVYISLLFANTLFLFLALPKWFREVSRFA